MKNSDTICWYMSNLNKWFLHLIICKSYKNVHTGIFSETHFLIPLSLQLILMLASYYCLGMSNIKSNGFSTSSSYVHTFCNTYCEIVPSHLMILRTSFFLFKAKYIEYYVAIWSNWTIKTHLTLCHACP